MKSTLFPKICLDLQMEGEVAKGQAPCNQPEDDEPRIV